jgi:release factor glutamine methyltransferase
LVVANPPYVRAADLAGLAPELHREPSLALVSGDDGLDVLDRLCAQTAAWLTATGALLFEVGAGQAASVGERLALQPGLRDVRTHRDLGGIERVLEAHAADGCA